MSLANGIDEPVAAVEGTPTITPRGRGRVLRASQQGLFNAGPY